MEKLTAAGQAVIACVIYTIEIMILMLVSLVLGLTQHGVIGLFFSLIIPIHGFFRLRRIAGLAMVAQIEMMRSHSHPTDELLPTDAFHGIYIDPIQNALNSRN